MNDVQEKLQELREEWKKNPDRRVEIEERVKNMKCCYPECTDYIASLHRVTCEIHGGKVIGQTNYQPSTIKDMQQKLLEMRSS